MFTFNSFRSTQIRTVLSFFGTTIIPQHYSDGPSTLVITPRLSILANSSLTFSRKGRGTCIDCYSNTCYPVFVGGDFNFPAIDWRIPTCSGCLNHSKFLTCTLCNGFTQLVHSPTHGNNCLDLVFASKPHLVADLSVVDPFSISCDHLSVEYSIICQHYFPDDHILVRNFFRADYDSIISYLNSVDWFLLHEKCYGVDDF